MSDDHSHLTFSQREGRAPLPEPMALENLSKNFRIRVARIISDKIQSVAKFVLNGYCYRTRNDINAVLADYACKVMEDYREPGDHHPETDKEIVKDFCQEQPYDRVLTLIEFFLGHDSCPPDLRDNLVKVFDQPPLVAYSVEKLNGRLTIVARSDVKSGLAARHNLRTVENKGPEGAREHLRKAANNLNEAKYADSVRDSIHAMEAVARTIDPDAGTLDQALKKLQKKGFLEHGAIKQAFEKLYGYTSDEEGIRHSLTKEGAPNVGLDEAMFMFSACAAGAAYLITKHSNTDQSPV